MRSIIRMLEVSVPWQSSPRRSLRRNLVSPLIRERLV